MEADMVFAVVVAVLWKLGWIEVSRPSFYNWLLDSVEAL